MFYVDPVKGSDSNAGTEASPFLTVQRAVEQTRKNQDHSGRRRSSSGSTIVLRAGTHYLSETIVLGPKDSGLTVVNYKVVGRRNNSTLFACEAVGEG